MMNEEFLNLMKDFLMEASEISLNYFETSTVTLKKDNSVLTEADIAISNLIHNKLDKYLKTSDHILIDEEDIMEHPYFDQAQLNNASYIWSVDPIDGTCNYANRIPLFGISIGILKNLKPWMGAVYFPFFKELFYSDSKETIYVQNAFSDSQKKIVIQPIDIEISEQAYFYCNDNFFNQYEWVNHTPQLLMQACAVIDLCWPAIGRGYGAIFDAHIWDFAGSWPIFKAAGLDLRSLRTGKILDHIHVDLFHHESDLWKLKDVHVLSSERNFPIIRSKIKERK